jgi:hypothetical protein
LIFRRSEMYLHTKTSSHSLGEHQLPPHIHTLLYFYFFISLFFFFGCVCRRWVASLAAWDAGSMRAGLDFVHGTAVMSKLQHYEHHASISDWYLTFSVLRLLELRANKNMPFLYQMLTSCCVPMVSHCLVMYDGCENIKGTQGVYPSPQCKKEFSPSLPTPLLRRCCAKSSLPSTNECLHGMPAST